MTIIEPNAQYTQANFNVGHLTDFEEKALKKAYFNCPFYHELTEQEAIDYGISLPKANVWIWLAIFIGFFLGLVIIIIYYSSVNNSIKQYNYQFKQGIHLKRLADKQVGA